MQKNIKIQKPPSGLYMVDWISTTKCPLRCKHCYSSSGVVESEDKELSTKDSLEMFKFFKKFGVKIFLFSGGEFILRQDYEKLLKEASKLFQIIFIPTNGYFIDSGVAKKFKKYKVTHSQVSIVSPNALEHDKFCGRKGSFKRALNAVKIFKQNNVDTSISPIIGNFNKDRIKDFIKLAYKLDCNIAFKRIVPIGRGSLLRNNSFISPKEYKDILISIRRYGKAIKGIRVGCQCEPIYNTLFFDNKKASLNKIRGGCMAGIGVVAINFNGDIMPCSKLQLSIGKFNTNTFEQIWNNSKTLTNLRNRSLLNGNCKDCLFVDSCGGCRGYAYAISSNILNEDPLCWRKIEKKV